MKKVSIVESARAAPPLLPGEVADLFGVDHRTVNRWTTTGMLPPEAWFRTPGGHRRFHRAAIERLLTSGSPR